MPVHLSDLGTAYKIRYDQLRRAVVAGDTGSVEELLLTRADILKDFGEGLLRKACYLGRTPIVRLLLGHGVDPAAVGRQKPDNLLKNVIWNIRRNSHSVERYSCVEILRLLLSHGADPNMMDSDYQVPLHYSCDLEKKDNDVALRLTRLLIDAGAVVDARNHHNETPLLKATNNDNLPLAALLIDGGADVNAKDNDGLTPLFYASRGSHPELVRLLLEQGADLSTRDNWGTTPLHSACASGRADIVRLLIEKGAEVDKKDNYNNSPVDLAMNLRSNNPAREQILDLFRERAPESTLESVLKLPPEDPLREKTLDWYREHHPEMVMEAYCSRQGPGGMS